MVEWNIVKKLMGAFPNSFINCHGEFIAHREANEYTILENCETELDVKCKVLEWFSRGAFKTQPFGTRKNKEFHEFMLNGINTFLGTNFDHEDMDLIYGPLGNAVNHEKTIAFINSGFDKSILKDSDDAEM